MSNTTASAKKIRAALQVPGRPPITQEAMAHLLGVSFATYNAWERSRAAPGRDNAQLLTLLAGALQKRTGEAVRALLEAHQGNRGALFAALLASSSADILITTTTTTT